MTSDNTSLEQCSLSIFLAIFKVGVLLVATVFICREKLEQKR